MCEYALLMLNVLNILEYTQINKVLNMPEFWMCLMQSTGQGHCTNYWAAIETEMHSENCQTLKMGQFAKRIMCECRHAASNFMVGEVSWN